jgi:DNA-binding GntR family transcriptional regulator
MTEAAELKRRRPRHAPLPNATVDMADLPVVLARQTSLPNQVAQALREAIISGKLPPRRRIVESKVARQLAIGQPTVREALKTLENEGLVVHSPNRGCCVTSLSAGEVEQIFRLRVEWEPLAVELALENRLKWTPERLLAIVGNFKRAARERRVEEYYRLDLTFHQTLWKLSGNRFLVEALSKVTVPVFAFCMLRELRHLDLDFVANARRHEMIARSLLAGNREQAKEQTRSSIQSFWKQIGRLVNSSANEEDQT